MLLCSSDPGTHTLSRESLCLRSSLSAGQPAGKYPGIQASHLPAPVHHVTRDERSADKLLCFKVHLGVLFPVIDDEFALISNRCSFKTHPRLIVDEREP